MLIHLWEENNDKNITRRKKMFFPSFEFTLNVVNLFEAMSCEAAELMQ